VTITPPSAEDVLSHLRAQVDELAHELAADDSADQGVLLKQRIFLLHRAVEQHAQVIEALQGDVRSLVDGWKGRFATPGSVTPQAARVVTTPTTPTTPTAAPAPVAVPVASPVAEAPREASPAAVLESPPVSTLSASPSVAAPGGTGVAAARPATATPGASEPRPGGPAPLAGQPRVIDELNASTFVERGWSRIASGDFVGAEAALDKAIELYPGDVNAETLLGWAQMGQGKLDEAMTVFGEVLERVPDHALALINVGFVHYKRGELDLAIEQLTTAIAFDSDRKAMLYAHYYLGLVRFEQEQYAEASGALLRAIELGPNMIEARFELGRVYWFSGRTDDAIATWRKGAELNKFNPWSARCRDMLSTIADGGAPSRVS
jgi:tetratricopeptide (TPR) repeat protein